MSRRLAALVYLLTIAFFICFFFWPIIEIVQGGFRGTNGEFTLEYFKTIGRNPIYLEGLFNAFVMACASTAVALVIAVPLAYFSTRFEFPAKKIFMGSVLLPIMLPPFVGAIGIQKLLGVYGVLNAFLCKIGIMDWAHPIDWLGHSRLAIMVLLNALSLYPILYLNTIASLANVDPAMEEAAANLGCRGIKKFWKITFPLVRPGVFAGCTIVFIWSFTELGVPLILDYHRITSVQIFDGLKELGGNPFPYALVTVMLTLSVVFYAVGKGLFGRSNFAMLSKASHASAPRTLCWWKQLAIVALFACVTCVALMPHLAVICFSFASEWYKSILPNTWTLANYHLALGHSLTIPSIGNSLIYASSATLLAIFIGTSVAFVAVKTKLPGRHILDAITMLPLAVPGLVMAFGYRAMSLEGKFFAFLNPIENPTALLIIAYAVRKLPFMVRSATAGLLQTSGAYEEAAQNLGCPPLKASFKITLPLIFANLIAGGLLVFSQTMLEVSDSLILAQKQAFYPITKAIYELMNLLGDGPYLACALGVWSMLFLAVTILGISRILGKNLGSIFRV